MLLDQRPDDRDVCFANDQAAVLQLSGDYRLWRGISIKSGPAAHEFRELSSAKNFIRGNSCCFVNDCSSSCFSVLDSVTGYLLYNGLPSLSLSPDEVRNHDTKQCNCTCDDCDYPCAPRVGAT